MPPAPSPAPTAAPTITQRIVHVGDLAGTAVFALQGALAAIANHLDPVGVLVLATLVGIGGGLIRDMMIGAVPPAAIRDWRYPAIILLAAASMMLLPHGLRLIPGWLLIGLDALGLSLFAVVGARKALDAGVGPLAAIGLGTISGVGGGVMRDLMLNQVPRVLYTDIYASAAAIGAAVVVLGQLARRSRLATAWVAGLACLAVRLLAAIFDWHLPRMDG